MEYLRELRMAKASELLLTTDKTIKEVWAEVGYDRASDFNHAFRRTFNVSPTEARRGASLDMRPVSCPTRPESLPSPAAPSGRTVLIVDDHPGTLQAVGLFLRLKGYVVAEATSAAGAEATISEQRVDAIILDMHLPDGLGVDFLRRCRYRGLTAPVIIYSADWEVYGLELSSLNACAMFKLDDVEDLVDQLAVSMKSES